MGCGAGLAAEALARRGFDVLGLDAAGEAIEAARAHAAGQNLSLTYRTGVAEDLLAEGARFPVITALEVIEHVPGSGRLPGNARRAAGAGGKLFLSTLNRTPQSFLAAKVGAEYLLRWLPVGTHDWRRFITPAELGAMLRHVGLRVTAIAGLAANPLTGRWTTSRDLSVNYLLVAGVKPPTTVPTVVRRALLSIGRPRHSVRPNRIPGVALVKLLVINVARAPGQARCHGSLAARDWSAIRNSGGYRRELSQRGAALAG